MIKREKSTGKTQEFEVGGDAKREDEGGGGGGRGEGHKVIDDVKHKGEEEMKGMMKSQLAGGEADREDWRGGEIDKMGEDLTGEVERMGDKERIREEEKLGENED